MLGPSRRGSALLPASRSVVWWACAFSIALVSLLWTEDARAYPFMIRHGYTNCSGCHADPSGGELLTIYGHAISYEVMSSRYGGGEAESSAATQRRIAKALAGAATLKSAPKKKPASEDEGAAEEEAGDEEATDEEGADEEATDGEGADEEAADEEGGGDEAAAEGSEEAAPAEPSAFDGMSGLTGPLLGIGPESESFLLGGSVRLATIYDLGADDDAFRFFPMQLDMYGQVRIGSSFRASASVGVLKVREGSPHGRPAQVTAGQGDGYNMVSRTHWVGFDFGDGAHTIRAGRLNLPFGIRMSEHVMWVRERTQTDRDSDQQHGVSLYMGFDSLRFELMGILGNYQVNPDAFRERGYAGYIEFAPSPSFTFGVSSLYTFAKDDRTEPAGLKTMRQAHGPFMRWSPAPALAILAEADVLLRSRREAGYVGFLQLDLEATRGLHFLATGELLDAGYPDRARLTQPPTSRSAGLGRPLPGGWLSLQWFFLPHFDVRVDAIIRQEKQILSQLHIYL